MNRGISQPTPIDFHDIDSLLAIKNEASLLKALHNLHELLDAHGGDYEILWRLSRAYVEVLNIKTDAFIEEKDEFKPLLTTLGEKANRYGAQAVAIRPRAPEALSAALQSYGYYSASFGIFRAVLKGAVGHYKDLAERLIEVDPSYLGGLGYRALGRLYYIAPFPVGNYKKAEGYLRKSLEIDPTVLETHYFLALTLYERGKSDQARDQLTVVVNSPPGSIEGQYIEAYKRSALEKLKAWEKQ